MAKEITVRCPHHFDEETIPLPSNYSDNCVGEIPCGHSKAKLLLSIKLRDGKVTGGQRAKDRARYAERR